MPSLTTAFAAQDPALLAQFWADLLGRDAVEDRRGITVAGSDGQLSLRFVPGEAPATGPHRMHLHLTSDGSASQADTVAAALRLGATHLDVGQRPEEGHVVLADPQGYAFCVIEAGNAYLAGTGFLGELASDGSREVGVFWSAAMGWPLVWDQDGETAIPSPVGGTKVAWGGPPFLPAQPREPQHFELHVDVAQQEQELQRLVGLGATLLVDETSTVDDAKGDAVLTDPDGVRFRVVSR